MKHTETQDLAKKAAGATAASFIQNGMNVGLGTGTTAAFFISSLIDRCRNEDLRINVVASSEKSLKLAREGGLHLLDPDSIDFLDVTVDGADEIDPRKRMIKGGGGALLREKILAFISAEMLVVIDETKMVPQLGISHPLPLEISPFAHVATLNRISQLGYQAQLRMKEDAVFITDNGNYIIDISFPQGCPHPEKDDSTLRAIPGVLEIGFFFNLAGRIVIGHPDGRTDIIA